MIQREFRFTMTQKGQPEREFVGTCEYEIDYGTEGGEGEFSPLFSLFGLRVTQMHEVIHEDDDDRSFELKPKDPAWAEAYKYIRNQELSWLEDDGGIE